MARPRLLRATARSRNHASAGVQYVEKQFHQILVVPGHAGPGSDIELTAACVARFCVPKAGEKIVVQISAVSDGFRSAPVRVEAIVATGAPPSIAHAEDS